MKKTALLFCSALLATALSVTAQADNEVKTTMESIGKSFGTAEKSDDLAVIKAELATLRESVTLVQKLVPEHLKNQPADSADRKLYTEGLAKLLTQIDAAQAAANSGKLGETKVALANLKATRNEYHKQLKP